MKRVFVLAVIILAGLVLSSCGGGGGSNSDTATPTSNVDTATPTSNVDTAFKIEFAQLISSNYQDLSSNNQSYKAGHKAGNLAKAVFEQRTRQMSMTQTGTGVYKITYGPKDILTILGFIYTYTAGTQTLTLTDSSGSPTDTLSQVNTLSIESSGLAYNYQYGGVAYSCTSSGTITMSGFLNESSFNVGLSNFSISGSTSAGDSYTWTVSSANVSVNSSTFPYPASGQSESGSIVWNGQTYNYTVNYDGTSIATVSVSGAETATFHIDLFSGKYVSAATASSYNNAQLSGVWSGTFTGNLRSGSITLVFDSSGALVGGYGDLGETYPSGNITADTQGNIHGYLVTIAPNGMVYTNGTAYGQILFSGSISSSGSQMTGSFAEQATGGNQGTFTVNKSTTSFSTSDMTGTWNGSFSGYASSGTIGVSIDSNGNCTATDSFGYTYTGSLSLIHSSGGAWYGRLSYALGNVDFLLIMNSAKDQVQGIFSATSNYGYFSLSKSSVSLSTSLEKKAVWGGVRYNEVLENNNVLYCSAGYGGLVLLDVTSPSNPQIIKKIDSLDISGTGNLVGDIVISNDYLFAATNSGFVVFDISNVLSPQEVKYVELDNTMGLLVYNDYLIVQADENVAYDISDPSNPSQTALSSDEINSILNNVSFGKPSSYEYGNYTYSITKNVDSKLVIKDSTDTTVGSYTIPANSIGFGEDFILTGTTGVVVATNGFLTLDISDVSSPVELALNTDQNMFSYNSIMGMVGDKLILGGWGYIEILDVSDISNISKYNSHSFNGYYDCDNAGEGIISDQTLYCIGDNELIAFNISDLSNFSETGKRVDVGISNHGNLVLNNNNLFIPLGDHNSSTYDNVYMYPDDSSLSTLGNVWSLAIKDNTLYAGQSGGLIEMYDISDTSSASYSGSFDMGVGSINPLLVKENHLVAENGSEIIFLDCTNPEVPSEVARFDVSKDIDKLSINGDKLYAVGGNKIMILDVSDIDSIQELCSYTVESGSFNDIHVTNSYVYVLNYSRGLFVLEETQH